MSKSLGNTIVPQDVIKESGADILRLWVAMSDYREEIRVSKEILARVVGGVPQAAQHAALPARRTSTTSIRRPTCVPLAKLEEVDRYILARYAEMAQRVLRAYEEYEYGADLAGAERSSPRST